MPLVFALVLLLVSNVVYAAISEDEAFFQVPEEIVEQELYKKLELERVVDGDTIMASGIKIRLWGIDAPEKNEPLYAVSSKALELFMNGGLLSCKFIEFDKYKRSVMHCFVGKRDLGASMVKTGFAKDYSKYSGDFYASEQRFAKKAKLGIWK